MRYHCLVLSSALACAIAAGQTASELDFLTGLTEFHDVRETLPRYMKAEARKLLDARRQTVERIATAADVDARRAHIRKSFLAALGGLPERSPMNPRVVGQIDRGDYRIEKIVFQSQPGFFVTANLYLPKKGAPPYPAVLYPLGHEPGGKAYPVWQQMLGSLAAKGYVALTWDPLGQGERVQLWDRSTGEPRLGNSTTEHTVIGLQCLLAGDNLARYTIWDGMRALDYLLSRPEVDPKRIACAGNSGGGTHTAYLSALDDRIQVAAPSCYITSWWRLLNTIGPQDAEQNLPPWLADGLDHPDFLLAFAPKPYLVLSAIRDFFSISGARESYREARAVYEKIGAAERIRMVDADDGHGYSKPRRMAAYQWFARWLKGAEDNEPEPEIPLSSVEELNCTDSGQLATSLGGETVYTLNRRRAAEAIQKRPAFDLAEVRRLSAFEPRPGQVTAWPYGAIDRDGFRIEKWVYESEPGILLPALVYAPSGEGRKPAVIIADGRGKSNAAAEAEALVRTGTVVLSVDLRGLGETRPEEATKGSEWIRYFGDFDSAMTGLLIGRPLLGMRARDFHQAVNLLAARADVDPGRIAAIGRGSAAVPALHAAALDPRIGKLALDDMLVSYRAAVESYAHRQLFENAVRGVLKAYDLPDLAAALNPRPVWIVDAADPMGRTLAEESVRSEYGPRAAAVRIVRRGPNESAAATFLAMLK
ncbi:MAG: acetylxylan esterase [Bryobacteraceae bacterium]|nr:acetylxylan esterase [Bryobacteraceae bacterium]